MRASASSVEFPLAGTSHVLRASQKDESHAGELAARTSELALQLLGPRTWIALRPWIEASTRWGLMRRQRTSRHASLILDFFSEKGSLISL